jgi:tetratricopeptide (TPR) repeat protein
VKRLVVLLIFLFLNVVPIVWSEAIPDDDLWKAFRQDKLEREGQSFLKQGFYDEALSKFKEADNPALKMKAFQDSLVKGLIVETYYLEGEYEKALDVLNPMVKMNPTQWNWQNEKTELEAVIKIRDAKSPEAILEFIKYMESKYKDILPPSKYNPGLTPTVASAFIRCYDQIGNYKGGITFMDKALAYWEKKSGQNLHRPDNKNQYFLIRQAFEQDEKEGKKGCMGKAGCVGRATKALIQSDYFPW